MRRIALLAGVLMEFVFLAFSVSCSNEADSLRSDSKASKKKATLLIYMAADNDLETYALWNIKMMERSKPDSVNILVLVDRAEGYDETEGNWTDTRLFQIVRDKSTDSSIKSKRLKCPQLGLSETENTELDMTNPSVLKTFIEFGKTNYEAENYALIIWGHGNGWQAVTIDERSSAYMSLHDLGNAVRGQGLCVIGFDSCFGGVLENVYEIKDCAEYTVACPGITSSSGWNYSILLEELSKNECDAKNIAEAIAVSSSQLLIFKNEKLGDLFNCFENFSRQLAVSVTDSASQQRILSELTNSNTYSYTQNPCDLYLDIISAAENFSSSSYSAEIRTAASNLKTLADQTVYSSVSVQKGIGVHLIPKSSSGAMAGTHSIDYLKDSGRSDQPAFIKESLWWVPTSEGHSGSLLDKLFYTIY